MTTQETRKKGRKEGKRSRKRRCSLTLTDRQNRKKKNEKEIRWTDEKRWKTDEKQMETDRKQIKRYGKQMKTNEKQMERKTGRKTSAI